MVCIRFQSDFIQRGITPEREITQTKKKKKKKKNVRQIFFHEESIYEISKLACTVLDERTDARTYGRTNAQPETNMPRHLLRSWRHNNTCLL